MCYQPIILTIITISRFQLTSGAGAMVDTAFGLFLAHSEAAEKSYMDATSILTPLINQGEN